MDRVPGKVVILTLIARSALAAGPLSSGIHPDIAVSRPRGDVIIYYKDGDDVVVKNCGISPAVLKRDCPGGGPPNRIPIQVFTRILASEVLLGDTDKLKPLTPEEVKAYRQNGVEDFWTRTRAFIQKNVSDPQEQRRAQNILSDAQSFLTSSTRGEDAVKKVNEMITEIVEKKIASSAITSVSSAKQSDSAVYTLLESLDASKAECGNDEVPNVSPSAPEGNPGAGVGAWLEKIGFSSANASMTGGLNARIKDCAKLRYCPPDALSRGLTCITSGPDAGELAWTDSTGKSVTWRLVARKRDPQTGEFHEVWQDSQSGKLWGDKLKGHYTYHQAIDPAAGDEKACAPKNDPAQNALAKTANAGVDEKPWGLPTIEELNEAYRDGITHVVPNLTRGRFLSASLNPINPNNIQDFDFGGDGTPSYRTQTELYASDSVLCVGR